MSVSLYRPEPAGAGPVRTVPAARRRAALVAAVAAAALVFAFVASWAPLARADESIAATPPDQSTDSLSPSGPDQAPADPGPTDPPPDSGAAPSEPPPAPTPPDTPPSDPAQPDPTPTGDQVTAAPVDPTGDTSGSTGSSADADSSKKASSTRDASAPAPPVASSGSTDSTTAAPAPVPPDAGGPADQMWVEQWDSFEATTIGGPKGGPPSVQFMGRGRFFLLGDGGRKAQLEGQARKNGQRPKLSALGAGLAALPGLPGHVLSSFFNLFAGGGGGATLMFYGLLCVLGTMLFPFPHATRSFRLPTVSWRPSEYVPPIEQPG